MQVIQVATIGLGPRDGSRSAETGSIEAGKRADLVLVDGNPPANFQRSPRKSAASAFANGRVRSILRSLCGAPPDSNPSCNEQRHIVLQFFRRRPLVHARQHLLHG